MDYITSATDGIVTADSANITEANLFVDNLLRYKNIPLDTSLEDNETLQTIAKYQALYLRYLVEAQTDDSFAFKKAKFYEELVNSMIKTVNRATLGLNDLGLLNLYRG